jgi:hypothetical protein
MRILDVTTADAIANERIARFKRNAHAHPS